jgi:ATP-dependent protease HslVU (ClpYQ) peptidase subunit
MRAGALPSTKEFVAYVASAILRKSEDEAFRIVRGGLRAAEVICVAQNGERHGVRLRKEQRSAP